MVKVYCVSVKINRPKFVENLRQTDKHELWGWANVIQTFCQKYQRILGVFTVWSSCLKIYRDKPGKNLKVISEETILQKLQKIQKKLKESYLQHIPAFNQDID